VDRSALTEIKRTKAKTAWQACEIWLNRSESPSYRMRKNPDRIVSPDLNADKKRPAEAGRLCL
jgi:hypothetical protein